MGLTPRQERFVDEYLVDLNATQAAIRSGYSKSGAEVRGCELLRNSKVAKAIETAMEARSQRVKIDQDRVLAEVARIAFFDIRRLYKEDGSLKRPDELDDEAAAVLSSVEINQLGPDDNGLIQTKKVRIFDKLSALTLAMRHLGMLRDKVDHNVNLQRSTQDLTDDELAAIASAGRAGTAD